jgi:hypothetical protein
MQLTADLIIQGMVAIGTPIAVYAAIRADLAALKVRTERAEKDIQHLFNWVNR